MSISLTPDQEHFIQTRLQAGKYRSAEEVLAIARRLLEEYDGSSGLVFHHHSEAEWVEDVRAKIDSAVAASEHTALVDGKTFLNSILERFQKAKQS
ncbi:MAG: type II toxin-antitoxin system ParD family antitoxin [Leptolyngbyaceae cyanobacterium]